MAYNLTEVLAEFASNLRYADIPSEAVIGACMGWTNCTVAILGGQDLKPVQIAYEALVKGSPGQEARLFFSNETANAPEAAFINGMAAHALDLDDIALRGSHPSAVLVPAILAEAEKLNSSGKDVITAYTAGFEVWGRIVDREKDSYVPKGWHTTCVVGCIAAAAAIANLKRLSTEQTVNSIAIAANCSSGIVAGWHGIVKPFQVGRAAQSAVIAVRLAEAGMYGSKEPLIGHGGILKALSPNGNVDMDTPIEGLGTRFQLEEKGLHTKLFPFPLSVHRAIDGTLDLVKTHDIAPDDVKKITVYIGAAQHKYLKASHGKFKLPITARLELALASAIIMRRTTPVELQPNFYERPDVCGMMERVHIEVDDSIPDDPEPNMGYSRKVRIELNNGAEAISEDATYYPGHWTRRLTEEQWTEKFDTFAGNTIKRLGLDGILNSVRNLKDLPNINELYKTK